MDDNTRMIRLVRDFDILLESELINTVEFMEELEVKIDAKEENIACFLRVIQVVIDKFCCKNNIIEQDIYSHYKMLIKEGKFEKR